ADEIGTVSLVLIKGQRVDERTRINVRRSVDLENRRGRCKWAADRDRITPGGDEAIEVQGIHVRVASTPGAEVRANRSRPEHCRAPRILDDEGSAGFSG